MRRLICFLLQALLLSLYSGAQSDTVQKPSNKTRKAIVLGGTGALAMGSLVGLNQIWYAQYNTGSFHFFNDNKAWLQMDKVGHAYTAYQTSRLMMDAFDWAGFDRKKKIWIGGSIGFVYLTAIEIMDGYSRGWGYSWGDQIANLAGSAMAMAQEGFWREQRFVLKYSYAESGLARFNPDLLGDSFGSRLIKDYNAQTYWLSFGSSVSGKKDPLVPKWLALSFGYSAYGMLGGHYNNLLAQEPNGQVYQMERQRRYYLSLDIDFTKIKARSKLVRTLFTVVNLLKFPAPAVEFTKHGVRFLPIYF